MGKKFKLIGLVLLTIFVFSVKVQAEDPLLDLLRKKGILTYEEAEKIRIETAQKKADALISLKGADIRLGGELELEFRDTQKDDGVSDSHARFQFDKFVLKPEVSFKDVNISLKGEIEFKEDEAFFAEGGIYFKNLPLNSKIFVGLKDRFIGISRKTESYPLLGTVLWRYEQLQINWEAELSPFYWGIAFGEGLRLGTKQVSEDSSYKMLADKRNVSYKTGHPEYGIKLGVKPDIGNLGTIDVLGFGFCGKLSDDDKATLSSKLPNYNSTSDKMKRYGARIVYNYKFDKLRKLTLVGEYAQLEDGKLERDGWYLQASHKWKFKRAYFKSFEPLIRYGKLDGDWEKSFSKPCSWDREMLTIALITELAKNVKLKTEYYINDEKTGRREVDNDELLVQLEFKF
ncbi:MAG: hypothetical protein DRP68_05660 [Candidatus Omnitrophota bacterium]|nr:MAG: hypothetical protein DRP68_05660 [Candidatus Omnitrophota bacterium]